MEALWAFLVLSLLIGELLFFSEVGSLPINNAAPRAYTREALLALRPEGKTPPANLPAAISRSAAGAGGTRRRKRGRKGGVRQRLRRRGNKPPLPSIILSNVRSLRSKMDELRLLSRFSYEYREANFMVLTETWLREDIPNSTLDLEGFSLLRSDREETSGKSRGGGLCIYVSKRWCSQYTIRDKYCDPDLELLCLSLRPFYLPREFGNIIICAAYVPPSANAARAASRLAVCIHAQMQRTPGAPTFVLGDLNHCRLESVFPGFHQYVKCGTRNNNVLDKCYGNIKNAYRAKALPPLANSDHATVQLMPTYISALKSSKPVQKTVLLWSEDCVETLKGCFLCTDWSIFHDLELNEATETITDYINFCVDNIVPKKTIRHFPNNKLYITKEVKECINNKKLAFKRGDRAGVTVAQKELNQRLRQARMNHRAALEDCVSTMNTKGLWDHMKRITNMNSSRNQIITHDELERADELNDFFLRHDTVSASLMPDNFNINVFLPTCDASSRVIIDPGLVLSTFSKIGNKRSTGPDGLPGRVLKTFSEELTAAWCPIFQQSLDKHMVPNIWKKSLIIPVPKVSCPSVNKDYRPIALTCEVMKCLERIIVNVLMSEVSPFLDPLQFAYRAGRSTEDAVVSITHLITKHLEEPKAYARVLFADFSSAFDTVCPKLLVEKLSSMNVNPFIIKWFYSLLTDRSQQVRVNSALSRARRCSTGVPQGGVSSPFLFTIYSNDCRNSQPNNHILKFSDDTVILSLLRGAGSPVEYLDEINHFKAWCEKNHLILNATKTKEMVFDFKGVRIHEPVVLGDTQIEQVASYKYLGIQMDNQLKWNVHVDYLCAKLAQRLHFLRRLRLFGVSMKVMSTFYDAVLGSIIRYGMAAWFGTLSVQLKARIFKLEKTAMKVIGKKDSPSLQTIFEKTVLSLANRILSDPSHTLFSEYELLPSGKRYRVCRCKTNRFKSSFIPVSTVLLNSRHIVHSSNQPSATAELKT